jgi:hypothetical protein
VGTGEPLLVGVAAVERDDVEEPTPGFLKALLRAGSTVVHERPGGDVHLMPIARELASGSVVLGCGHVVTKPPLAKGRARGVRCVGCAEGLQVERGRTRPVTQGAPPAASTSGSRRKPRYACARMLTSLPKGSRTKKRRTPHGSSGRTSLSMR